MVRSPSDPRTDYAGNGNYPEGGMTFGEVSENEALAAMVCALL